MSFFSWIARMFSGKKTVTEAKAEKKAAKKAQKKAVGKMKKAQKAAQESKNFMDVLETQLSVDEGVKYRIYLDHLGLPTFGIGHLILESDPEHGMEVGTAVTPGRVRSAFVKDMQVSLDDCRQLFDNFDDLPEEVRLICANMSFNLGRTRLSKFKNFRAAVNEGNWKTAAEEMKDSKWYGQVGNRSKRLYDRMKAV